MRAFSFSTRINTCFDKLFVNEVIHYFAIYDFWSKDGDTNDITKQLGSCQSCLFPYLYFLTHDQTIACVTVTVHIGKSDVDDIEVARAPCAGLTGVRGRADLLSRSSTNVHQDQNGLTYHILNDRPYLHLNMIIWFS